MNALTKIESSALSEVSPVGMMLKALAGGMTVEQMQGMLAIQKEWEANEARKAFNLAFSNFKAEAVKIIKNKVITDGPLKGKKHAELSDVVNATAPALSKHGLSTAWRLTKDDKDWMEVTCTLSHEGGHSESVSMGGAPDTGPGRNAIQARGSAKSYLERYTLTAILGLSAQDSDDDGAGGKKTDLLATWTERANETVDLPSLSECRKAAAHAFKEAGDTAGWSAFKLVVALKIDALKGKP